MDAYQEWTTHSHKKVVEDGTEVHKQPDEFDDEDFKKMEKNAKAKNSCILVLVQMSILAFLSTSQPMTDGMPFK